MADDNPVSRRDMLVGGGILATLGLAGTATGAANSTGDDWVGDFAHLVEQNGPKPNPVGKNRYFYWDPADQAIWYTTWDSDQWHKFGQFGDGTGDTRTDISDDGTTVVTNTIDTNFGVNLSVTDDGDGSVTVDAGGIDTRTNISEAGTTLVTDTQDLNFKGSGVSVADDGDQTATATITDTDTNTHADVEDNGTSVQTDTTTLNFQNALNAASDAAGGTNIDVDETAISHDNLAGVSAGDHHVAHEHPGDQPAAASITADDGTTIFDYAQKAIDKAVLDNAYQLGGGRSDVTASVSFNNWRQPNTSRPVEVTVEFTVYGSGGNMAEVEIDLDDNADGVVDHTFSEATRAFGLTSNPDMRDDRTTSFVVPAGGKYRPRNVSDPAANNSINAVTELVV